MVSATGVHHSLGCMQVTLLFTGPLHPTVNEELIPLLEYTHGVGIHYTKSLQDALVFLVNCGRSFATPAPSSTGPSCPLVCPLPPLW